MLNVFVFNHVLVVLYITPASPAYMYSEVCFALLTGGFPSPNLALLESPCARCIVSLVVPSSHEHLLCRHLGGLACSFIWRMCYMCPRLNFVPRIGWLICISRICRGLVCILEVCVCIRCMCRRLSCITCLVLTNATWICILLSNWGRGAVLLLNGLISNRGCVGCV